LRIPKRISYGYDLNFLKALQTIFDSSEQALYQLSSEQQTAIEKGRNEIKEGNFHKNEEVISEMREWLKKK
jgi:predicted transcriptional regulator